MGGCNIRYAIVTLSSFMIFIIGWEAIAVSGLYNQKLFPPASAVLYALDEEIRNGELFEDVFASFWRVVVGFTVGSFVGISAGLVCGRIKLIQSSMGSVLSSLSYAPPVALLPLFILWFGVGNNSIISLISWSVFFPVFTNTKSAVAQINREHIWVSRNQGANLIQQWKYVILPGAIPQILTGLRLGLTVALIMLVIGEMAGTSTGIGYRIEISHQGFRADKMLLGISLLGVVGYTLDAGFVYAVKRKLPWATKDETK